MSARKRNVDRKRRNAKRERGRAGRPLTFAVVHKRAMKRVFKLAATMKEGACLDIIISDDTVYDFHWNQLGESDTFSAGV